MINVLNPTCQNKPGICNKQPCFNFKGEKKGIYCIMHKKDNMVNVKDKKCKHLMCDIIPVFGYSGGKTEYCTKHKKIGMIDITKICCKQIGCETKAGFNVKGKKSIKISFIDSLSGGSATAFSRI